jgi:hypothetical protein
MSGQLASVMFFVPLDRRPASDAALFEAVGLAHGKLGPLFIETQGIDVLDDHACVWLSFLRSVFFDLVGHETEIPLEQDPALPIALALRDGAARAGADVAVLATEAHLINDIQDWYWMVMARDPSSLLRQGFSVLYLGDAMSRDWNPAEGMLDNHDELPGGPGRTLFAQRGRDRWY